MYFPKKNVDIFGAKCTRGAHVEVH
jgi:hypothetical protein